MYRCRVCQKEIECSREGNAALFDISKELFQRPCEVYVIAHVFRSLLDHICTQDIS